VSFNSGLFVDFFFFCLNDLSADRVEYRHHPLFLRWGSVFSCPVEFDFKHRAPTFGAYMFIIVTLLDELLPSST
jgi:hypothetical protein